ncbi:MAG: hypothetical protein E7519_06220 [Ruminococcaceae bacterium]|nr:hypothetical protein [Oscillospiraceae bacterium]
MNKALRMDFYRVLTSLNFWGAVLGIAAINVLNSLNFLSNKNDIVQIFSAGDAPFFSILILIFETLPFGLVFCEDWENRYIRSSVIRTSPVQYSIAKVITCFYSALLAGLLGRLLFVLMLFPFMSPVDPNQNSFIINAVNNPQGAAWLLVNHHYFTWILIEALERSLQGSIYATLSLWLSTKITNIFVTLAMPVIAYYIYLNIANLLELPKFLILTAVFENDGIFPNNFLFGTLYAFFFAVIFSSLFGILFVKGVKRRLEDG